MKLIKIMLLSVCAVALVTACTGKAAETTEETTGESTEVVAESSEVQETTIEESSEDSASDMQDLDSVLDYASYDTKVISLDKENGIIKEEYDDELKTDEKTVFWSMTDGKKIEFDDIKVGDQIECYISDPVSNTIPSQVYAYAIFTKIDDQFTPEYLEIKSIKKDDDSTTLMIDDEIGYVITSDVDVSLYSSGEQVSNLDDVIKEGVRFLAWQKELTAEEVNNLENLSMISVDKVVIIDKYK